MNISYYPSLYGMELSGEEKQKVHQKVKKIVEELHAGGFVHGDIRHTNILVDRESLGKEADDVIVHLIDFDWAGPIGIARYPMRVNKETVWRPDGVRAGELITVEHDQEMVRNLFREVNPIDIVGLS